MDLSEENSFFFFHSSRETLEAFQYLKRPYKKAGKGLLFRGCSDRARDNSFKLNEIWIR